MQIDRYTPAIMAAGRLELGRNLKWLEAIGITPCPDCEAGEMYHPDNLAAFVIRPNGPGWTADIVLERVPPGVPDVIGTPDAAPLPTREIALAAGRVILTMILSASYGDKAKPARALH